MSRRLFRSLLSGATVALLALLPAGASAQFALTGFDGEMLDGDGSAITQAGATPFEYTTDVAFSTKLSGQGFPVPDGQMKRITVDLPPGIVGDPTATPNRCTEAQLAVINTGQGCPAGSQVGYVRLTNSIGLPLHFPIYNMVAAEGVPGVFAFNVAGNPVHLRAELRPEDYGITVDTENISQVLPLVKTEVTLWGVPADERHDGLRDTCLALLGPTGQKCPIDTPETAFLRNQTSCTSPGVGVSTSLEATSWEEPARVLTGSFKSHLAPPNTATEAGPDGCEKVPFRPRAYASLSERGAGVPSGLAVDIDIPQSEGPGVPATSHVKDVWVTLPVGVAVNAASAGGLRGCGEGQFGLANDAPPSCPASSKLGTVVVRSPLVDNPLSGSVYLATQGANPFNSLIALYIAVSDEQSGVTVKLSGKVTTDARTGQLVASFLNNPQLPFESMELRMKDGPRAPLSTPARCGTYTARVEVSSWSRPDQVVGSDSPMTIDRGCGRDSRFTPGFEAGSADPAGGGQTAFSLHVSRPDGQSNIARIEASLPQGLLAKLANVPLCSDSLIVRNACDASSQIGAAVVSAGSGAMPVFVPQPGRAPTSVHLAGPYAGAPYSIVVQVPAQAGPFDLGTIAVRNGLYVDSVTSQVTVKSDPLPQILEGIPISYRDIRINVSRGDFVVNPTSCDAMSVDGRISSAAGASVAVSDRFQVANCGRLGFKPKLALRFFGKTKRTGYPRLRATLRMPDGGANVEKAVVLMPGTELLENAHIKTTCTRDEFAARACPKGSIYGRARAFTPLLDEPLEGPVYLRSNGGARELPDLVADLRGAIDIELVGYIDSVRERLRTRFVNVPDAPVSKFVLNMFGGKKGLIVHNTNVCRVKPRASAFFDGQNGKVRDIKPLVRTDCPKANSSASHRRR